MFARNLSTGVAASLMLVAAVAVLAPSEAVSLPSLSGSFACAKDYMINLVRDRIISKSALAVKYQETMKVVRQRYEEAEQAGELAGKDDKEKENFYLKLTVEEMRKMRESIAANHEASTLDLSDTKGCRGKTDDDLYDPDAEVEGWTPDEAWEDDKEIEAALMTELEELERQASEEDEMGWSMSPEAREALKEQTRVVLVDLMNNEARQIAMALLTSYMTGGGSLSTVLLPLLGGLKFKLAQFLINAITQVVSSIMGRPIEVKPVESLVKPQAVTPAIDAPASAA